MLSRRPDALAYPLMPCFPRPHTTSLERRLAAPGRTYGWYPGVNYVGWRGDGDKHCYMCVLPGNASEWQFTEAAGAWSYTYQHAQGERARRRFLKEHDADGTDGWGRIGGALESP